MEKFKKGETRKKRKKGQFLAFHQKSGESYSGIKKVPGSGHRVRMKKKSDKTLRAIWESFELGAKGEKAQKENLDRGSEGRKKGPSQGA